MAVATIDYGTFKSHTGTLAEVCGAMKGLPADHIIALGYDAGRSVYFAIQRK